MTAWVYQKHIDEQQHHGLKIMQERTHSLGGEFDISQNTPKGTLVRIWFYLNFMRTRNNMVLKIFTAANPARLLLVDDHPMLRRGLADLLSLEKDVQVIAEANHGMEALDILNQEIVDLVILDHTMPILNGIETLKKYGSWVFKPKFYYLPYRTIAKMFKMRFI